jgi:flavin-dependent dehydrogenase
MIPPVTGNGMSMAFESAEMAMAPLAAWSRGESSWNEARQRIARDCDAAFARRLAWAKWLQRIVLMPALQNPLVALAARGDWFWRIVFERTR